MELELELVWVRVLSQVLFQALSLLQLRLDLVRFDKHDPLDTGSTVGSSIYGFLNRVIHFL